MLVQGIDLDSTSISPLHRQLYEGIRHMVLSGDLAAGSRMPSTRTLAHDLGVSRFTVVTAIEQLTSEGYLRTQAGSGTFVETMPTITDRDFSQQGRLDDSISHHVEKLSNFANKLQWVPSINSNKSTWLLHMSAPDHRLFPDKTWSRITKQALHQIDTDLACYRDRFEEPTLLEKQIATQVAVSRGIRCDPSDVVVTFGAHHAVNLVSELLLDETDTVVFEEPGMAAVKSVFKSRGCNLVPMMVDGDGANPTSIVASIVKLAFVTAAKQQPLIVPMRAGRKREMLNWAADNDVIIVEDDLGSEFRYEGSPIPPLKAMDSESRVIYIGAFSMSLLQTLRVGYMIMPRKLAQACRRLIQVRYRSMPLISEQIIARFIQDGHYSRHIHKVRRVYAQRQEALLEILERDFGEFFEPPVYGAGFYVICYFRNQTIDDRGILLECNDNGVGLEHLSYYYNGGTAPKKGLLVGFACNTKEEIEKGTDILLRILEKHCRP